MNSSLVYVIVLIVLHVLNAIVMVSNVNKSNSSGDLTNGQIYLKNHNMVILMTSCDMSINQYFNNVVKPKKWKCVQCVKVYNNITTISVVQISNKESMHLENERISLLQSKSMINTMQSNKNSYVKATTTNIFKSTLSISSTSNESTFKTLICSNMLASGEVEVIASKTPSNEDYKLHKRSGSSIELKTLSSIKYCMCYIGANVEIRHQCYKLSQQVCRSIISMSNQNPSQLYVHTKSNIKYRRLIPTNKISPAILQVLSKTAMLSCFFFLLFFYKKKNGQTKKNLYRSYDKATHKSVCEYAVALPSECDGQLHIVRPAAI
ncbi:hypothetical protein RFI_38254, partial [Reticulomyxa filosa]